MCPLSSGDVSLECRRCSCCFGYMLFGCKSFSIQLTWDQNIKNMERFTFHSDTHYWYRSPLGAIDVLFECRRCSCCFGCMFFGYISSVCKSFYIHLPWDQSSKNRTRFTSNTDTQSGTAAPSVMEMCSLGAGDVHVVLGACCFGHMLF